MSRNIVDRTIDTRQHGRRRGRSGFVSVRVIASATIAALAVSVGIGIGSPASAAPAATATITVGSQPVGVAFSPDGSKAYVTNAGANSVSVINVATNTVVGDPIAVGLNPTGVAFSPDGSKAYVTNALSNSVSVIDVATNTVVGAPIAVGAGPLGVAFSPDGLKAYVTNYGVGANSVSVIEVATNTVVGTIAVGLHPAGVAFSPDGLKAYVTNQFAGSVSVIDVATNTVVGAPIAVGLQPRGVAFSPNGLKAYVTNFGAGANSVSVIEVATNTVVGTIAVGLNPIWVAFSPDGSKAYVTNIGANSVSVINVATNTVVGDPIAVGFGPAGVAFSPDGSKAYVTNFFSGNSVSVIATSHSVSFDSQGGSAVAASFYRTDVAVTLPTAPTRVGYTFNGWFAAASGGTALVSPYSPPGVGAITVFAQWSVQSHGVTFDSQGGSDVAARSYLTDGALTLPAAPTRVGFTFTGWFVAASGGIALGAQYSPSGVGAITLFAQWSAQSHGVTFDSQGGSDVADRSYLTDGSVTLPAAPNRAGFTFNGWFMAASGGSALPSSYAPGGTGAITVFAQWSALSHGVTFNSQGGSDVAASTYSTGGPVMLPAAPIRSGFTFTGWFAAASGGTALAGPQYSPPGVGAITVFAQWTAVPAVAAPKAPVGLAATGASLPLAVPLGMAMLLIAAGGFALLANRKRVGQLALGKHPLGL